MTSKPEEFDNPAELSREDLLRFLEASPQILSERTRLELAREGTPGRSKGLVCPTAEWYLRLATGELEPETIAELRDHAAVCEICSATLARSLKTLEGDPSPEETAAIAQMALARQEQQRLLARELAETSAQSRRVLAFRAAEHPGAWAAGAGIAAALLLAGGVFWWQRADNSPERELAKAYEEARTLELRIPEASFAVFTPGSHTRGSISNHESPALLDARAKLARELERSPQDGHLLELQGRADVLEERYDSAIETLERLIAEGPATTELLTDVAVAYYQRGLVTGSEVDRSTALDDLARADKLAPTDPVVLFNEAIVMEDRGQMMNAVEVWNRYITVERDAKWREEGKRKLAALEQTLNRLKSHEGRVRQMLASPAAMDALAADPKMLAALDEELSVYRLDTLLLAAFPEPAVEVASGEQPRGSPCDASCAAARRLLKAIGTSLEIQHHDSWLTDLLSPDIDSMPAETARLFARGMQQLGQAVRKDLLQLPMEGEARTLEARKLFLSLEKTGHADKSVLLAVRVAGLRTDQEYLYALQRQVKFDECRAAAHLFREKTLTAIEAHRYPWIATQEQVIEKICDDTPATRKAGRALAASALASADRHGYALLAARTEMMMATELADSGDAESAERLLLLSLRQLYTVEGPAARILNSIGSMGELELDTPRGMMGELCLREAMHWVEHGEMGLPIESSRRLLAQAMIRNGEVGEAIAQLRTVDSGSSSRAPMTSENSELLADALLESGDLVRAGSYLDLTAKLIASSSDTWLARRYAITRGQLELATGHPDHALTILESAIRMSEGNDVRHADQATSAEFAGTDHDAYGELAASWLAQGRSPESVLALWERFRLRSRGLPIAQCASGALDCELPRLVSEQRRLGESVMFGQILLLDRVLQYRVDRHSVTWATKPAGRRVVLDAAQALERAVSSPYTTPETAAKMGSNLTGVLLPHLPASIPSGSSLLLEADPLLANLSWPVLPTQAGPLGIAYPLAEMRSLIVSSPERDPERDKDRQSLGASISERALVVGASVAEGEPPLPEAMNEAAQVNSRLHSRKVLLGEQATAAHVATELDSATIFHFAGHALQTQDGTELLLAASPTDASPWIDREFLRRHPPRACRLAVLSACSTGTRATTWVHPLQSMVEAFEHLGVPEVVATRWQIDSKASVPFIDTFYGALAQGETAAAALAAARGRQASQPQFKNPYYWGAFYATGREDTRPLGDSHASY